MLALRAGGSGGASSENHVSDHDKCIRKERKKKARTASAEEKETLTNKCKPHSNLATSIVKHSRPDHMFQYLQRDLILMFGHKDTAVLNVSILAI
jgi:hypothetical protein